MLVKNVLFLCTGNSCRSIMAEALLNHIGKGVYRSYSAGSKPLGLVHPVALATLKRHGVEHGVLRSKSWDEFTGQSFHMIITVCDNASKELCPLFHGECLKLHWNIADPASVQSDKTKIEAAFDEAFLILKTRIESELLTNC